MIYSKTCEYAIRALVCLARRGDQATPVRKVSEETGVSQAYVAKVLQCLARSRLLNAHRGPGGGYSPAFQPGEITLMRVVQSLDDPARSPFSNCIMGLDQCNDRNPCPLHPIWARAKEAMVRKLSHCTIADLMKLTGRFRTGRQRRFALSRGMREIFSG